MILPSSAQSSPFHTPYARRCMVRPEALQGLPTPLPPEAVIGWPPLRDVFGASSTTAIGEPALLKPVNIPAKRLGGATAGGGDPTVHAQLGQVGSAMGA